MSLINSPSDKYRQNIKIYLLSTTILPFPALVKAGWLRPSIIHLSCLVNRLWFGILPFWEKGGIVDAICEAGRAGYRVFLVGSCCHTVLRHSSADATDRDCQGTA